MMVTNMCMTHMYVCVGGELQCLFLWPSGSINYFNWNFVVCSALSLTRPLFPFHLALLPKVDVFMVLMGGQTHYRRVVVSV